jgi:ribulose-phosphate 3-epimerase
MKKGIRVVPAVLTDDIASLTKMAKLAETFTDYVQFDIMDGKFVPSRSVSCRQIAELKTRLSWEAHLMVEHPETCLDDLHRAGAKKVVFHFEGTSPPEKSISLVKGSGMKAGMAVNPETPIDDFVHLVNKLDSVLFLSVNPGFYGSKFIPEVLDKLISFRRTCPGIETGIDGGIKETNIAQIARTGVDVIFVGSAVFLQPDPAASFHSLQALAEANAIHENKKL